MNYMTTYLYAGSAIKIFNKSVPYTSNQMDDYQKVFASNQQRIGYNA